MLIIEHRINNIIKLSGVPFSHGVEMDIHAFGERLIVHHDALQDGERLDHWLKAFNHAIVIFNIKEEGIEEEVLIQAKLAGISNFFMLDISFPSMIRLAQSGERRIAVRVSEYEPIEQALRLASWVDWAWIDVFSGLPVGKTEVNLLRAAGLKLCLVSPELHKHSPDKIAEMKKQIKSEGIYFDAVCTKHPELWKNVT